MELIMDYKVVFIPVVPGDVVFEREYKTREEAESTLLGIADYTLLLHECSLMLDHSNYGMVMKRDGSDWIEIDGDGNEI